MRLKKTYIDHVFHGCFWAKHVCFCSPLGLRVEDLNMTFITLLEGIILKAPLDITKYILSLCYEIWSVGNKHCFEGKILSAYDVVSKAWRNTDDFKTMQNITLTATNPSNVSTIMPIWRPPDSMWYKLNVDASGPGNYEWGIGAIVRDANGFPLATATWNLLVILVSIIFMLKVLDLIPGDEREFLSSDSIDRSESNDNEAFELITPEFLGTLRASGLPNHRIKLKIGTPIMLLRNLDQSEGLCNGTRLIVTKLANHVIEAKIMSGKNIGNVTYISRMSMSPSDSQWPFKLIRRQFPIVVSYAMTINKSQGQSLASVGLYLPKPVFSHWQFLELRASKD